MTTKIPISIHTPARGVTAVPPETVYSIADYFNPHSRKGSDCRLHFTSIITYISIHTPARGVTDLDQYYDYLGFISIHAPARGVTGVRHYTRVEGYFNPHSRKGSDVVDQDGNVAGTLFQSTLPQGE